MTDVVGSTALWEDAPDQMVGALDQHDAILAAEAARSGGRVVKARGEGDSAFIVFEEPAAALAFAAASVRRFGSHAWPTPRALAVRVAIHRGWAADRDDDLVGPAVNRCARLRSLAHGGQILVSDEVRRVVGDALDDGCWFKDLGRHRLRDVVEPERVWQLCHVELPAEFPALGSENLTPTNLPVQLTSFLGRRDELDALAADDARLITVHGAGGLGKTRLAVEHAAEQLGEHPDGVWLAPLDAVGDDEGVAPAVVAALGLRAERGGSIEAIEAYLRARRALLVLDNAEHVLEATGGLVVGLLHACAHLRVIVTSREPLGVPGESLLTLTPLDVPPGADLAASTAGRLFAERARLRDHAFAITEENRDAVARICALVDGMPLGIELAAARVGTFDVLTLAELLADRFRILNEGPRTAPDRQRSMRGAIDWSFELLDAELRDIFEQLAVFAGSFTLDAARAVAGPVAVEQIPSLVERSMLVAEPGEDGMRYRFLAPIAAYASERFRARSDRAHVVGAALAWAAEWIDPPQGETPDVPACAQEWPNLRSLLADPAEGSEQVQLRVVGSLAGFFTAHGLIDEGSRLLDQTLARAGDARPLYLARAHATRGGLALTKGDLDGAADAFLACMTAGEEAGSRRDVATALSGLAEVARARGDYEAAEARFGDAIRRLREDPDPVPLAVALGNQANLLHAQRRFGEARAALEEALAIAPAMDTGHVLMLSMRLAQIERTEGRWDDARRRLEMCVATARERGDRRIEGAARSMMGGVLAEQGELARAIDELDHALGIRREISDAAGIAASLYALGDALTSAGQLARAGEVLDESRALWQGMRSPLGEAAVLHACAVLARACDDAVAAEAHATDALERFRTLEDREGISVALAELGGIAIAAGDARRGVERIAAADALARMINSTRSRAASARREADLTAARDALGANEVDALLDAGGAAVLHELLGSSTPRGG